MVVMPSLKSSITTGRNPFHPVKVFEGGKRLTLIFSGALLSVLLNTMEEAEVLVFMFFYVILLLRLQNI
jgi:hypothetical protein